MHGVLPYLAFTPRENQWWCREFSHVTPFFYCNTTWTVLDLHRKHCTVQNMHGLDDVEDMLSYFLHHHTVLKLPVFESRPSHFWHPMTCVSFSKHLYGIPSRALLPDALFRNLLALGAEIANEPENPRRNSGAEAAADTV